MPDLFSHEDFQAAIERFSPREALDRGWGGFVFLAENAAEAKWMMASARAWASKLGFPIRMPHHSVSIEGLAGRGRRNLPGSLSRSEVDLAHGGILLLDEFERFDQNALHHLRDRIVDDRLVIAVVGVDSHVFHPRTNLDLFMEALRWRADTLGLPVVTKDDLTEGTDLAAQSDVSDALKAINAHRRAIGMAPLDPTTAGWTHEDVLLEQKRIARLPNPLPLAPQDPVLAEMAAELESALVEQDLDAVDDLLEEAAEFYGEDARETRALYVLVRRYGVLANPSVAKLKQRLMPP